jgi:hypothetical protein
MMNVDKHYTKYMITDGDFHLGVKIGDKGITLVNKYGAPINDDNAFLFRMSSPEMIDKFAKAMKLAVKLSKDSV